MLLGIGQITREDPEKPDFILIPLYVLNQLIPFTSRPYTRKDMFQIALSCANLPHNMKIGAMYATQSGGHEIDKVWLNK